MKTMKHSSSQFFASTPSLFKRAVLPPEKPSYNYGGKTIPEKLVLYERKYVYAMVPLAQKLKARKEINYIPLLNPLRYHDCP